VAKSGRVGPEVLARRQPLRNQWGGQVQIDEVRSADALIVDARPGAAMSGAELGARLAPMIARLRADSARVATQYRIERRQVSGDVAVDAGYMRQTIARSDGVAGPPPMVTRFLVTLRQAGGRWRIVADASMPASEAAWAGAARSAGLKFDG
jgi:ketosteroid isomerase-like protein